MTPPFQSIYAGDVEYVPATERALIAQALRYLDDAIEGTGCDEGYLLANDEDNVWCRVFSARSTLRAAIGPGAGE